MQYIPRMLDIASLLKKKSIFLFGPRSTGKTTLIEHRLPEARALTMGSHSS